AYVYGWGAPGQERLIVVDLGVTFPDMDGSPGVDLIFADVAWLEENAERIEAIFITHAHEDHVGAVGHLWSRLRAPVFTRAFTGHHARRKMEEQGNDPENVTIVAPWPEITKAGPFSVGFAPISHSVPESSALIIDSPGGRIVHTGDFKTDPTPLVGEPFDETFWREIGDGGVDILTCDSTNVFSPDPGRSEATLGPAITKLVQNAPGMVVATTFASNVARVKTLAEAGVAAGRSVCLLGRAMRRMVEASVLTGVLEEFPKTISPEDASEIPRENVMLLVTGSQGERRAASAALARGRYMGLELSDGDTFLFSSKTIPGNEKGVIHIMNALAEKGVEVVDDSSGLYHVSGHANRPDLDKMHELIRPKIVVPMHGEFRHLREHSRLAQSNGAASVIAPNGTMVDLTGDFPKVVDYIETGRTYLDGKVQIGALDGIVRDRLRMGMNGHVLVTLILEENDPLGEPWVEVKGLAEQGRSKAPLVDVLEEDLSQLIGRAKHKTLADDDKLEEELRRAVRKSCDDEIGKKPEVTVVISRLT
ncbi:MAG: ribonuclease J, partial [Silicimonas sp.]|nr:ribonuclease J [Silicimonas sp.]